MWPMTAFDFTVDTFFGARVTFAVEELCDLGGTRQEIITLGLRGAGMGGVLLAAPPASPAPAITKCTDGRDRRRGCPRPSWCVSFSPGSAWATGFSRWLPPGAAMIRSCL